MTTTILPFGTTNRTLSDPFDTTAVPNDKPALSVTATLAPRTGGLPPSVDAEPRPTISLTKSGVSMTAPGFAVSVDGEESKTTVTTMVDGERTTQAFDFASGAKAADARAAVGAAITAGAPKTGGSEDEVFSSAADQVIDQASSGAKPKKPDAKPPAPPEPPSQELVDLLGERAKDAKKKLRDAEKALEKAEDKFFRAAGRLKKVRDALGLPGNGRDTRVNIKGKPGTFALGDLFDGLQGLTDDLSRDMRAKKKARDEAKEASEENEADYDKAREAREEADKKNKPPKPAGAKPKPGPKKPPTVGERLKDKFGTDAYVRGDGPNDPFVLIVERDGNKTLIDVDPNTLEEIGGSARAPKPTSEPADEKPLAPKKSGGAPIRYNPDSLPTEGEKPSIRYDDGDFEIVGIGSGTARVTLRHKGDGRFERLDRRMGGDAWVRDSGFGLGGDGTIVRR